MTLANETIANLTGNVTGEPTGWGNWILGILKWVWGIVWNTFGMAMGIMETNPIMGFIIILLIVVLLFWIGWWFTMASTQGMRMFLIIGLIIIVVFVLLYLWGAFDLPGMFSGWLQGSIGMGNETNATVEVAKNVTDGEGINFWK